MKEQYSSFAYFYDRLMTDVDYNEWVNYIETLIERANTHPKKVLELACGTGNITIPMALKGFSITAVDISQDMLTIAKDKAVDNNADILFIQQDMTQLEIQDIFEIVMCCCDGVNYIIDSENLLKMFMEVHKRLNKDGIFIFDISSYYKLSNIIGNNTFGENTGDIIYLWENFYDKSTDLLEMDLTFFNEAERGLFRKTEELHIQRAYKTDEIIYLLQKSGFNSIEIFADFLLEKPHKNSQRIFFSCSKK